MEFVFYTISSFKCFFRSFTYLFQYIQKHRESTFFVVFIAIFHLRFVSYEIYLFEF